jgi:hypothetical protein
MSSTKYESNTLIGVSRADPPPKALILLQIGGVFARIGSEIWG